LNAQEKSIVLQKIQTFTKLNYPKPLELFDLFFLKAMRQWMINWINDFPVQPNKMSISDDDILSFIQINLKAQYPSSKLTWGLSPH
jgi:hypothetical protein